VAEKKTEKLTDARAHLQEALKDREKEAKLQMKVERKFTLELLAVLSMCPSVYETLSLGIADSIQARWPKIRTHIEGDVRQWEQLMDKVRKRPEVVMMIMIIIIIMIITMIIIIMIMSQWPRKTMHIESSSRTRH
jgi:hypothetical protein